MASKVCSFWRQPELPRPYRAWGYPLTPLLFLGLSGWTLVYILRDKPTESLYGLATLAGGLLVYLLARRVGTPATEVAAKS